MEHALGRASGNKRPRGIPDILPVQRLSLVTRFRLRPDDLRSLECIRSHVRCGDRATHFASLIALPFRVAGRWSRKHRRALLYSGLAAVCLFAVIAYVMLPAWLPDWVISHSTFPNRILRATHVAFNGHFEATPALKQILGDEFDDFLLQHLYDSNEAARDAAALILAYSQNPVAEEALVGAYLKEQSDDVKLSLLHYLGWIATEASREFLVSILDGRVDGPRWSAIRTLSWWC